MGRSWARAWYLAAVVAAVAAASMVPSAAAASPASVALPASTAARAQAAAVGISVSPSTGLRDEQVVTVSGTGLTPGGLAIGAECVTFPPPPSQPLISGCQTSP